MAVCDICNVAMEGIHPSISLKKGDSLPVGWLSASNKDVTNCRNLVKGAIKVHIEKLGVSLQITDDIIQKWIKEKEALYGQSDWLLCPTCAGILKGQVNNEKTKSGSFNQIVNEKDGTKPLITYEMQLALYLPVSVLKVFTYGAKAAKLSNEYVYVNPEIAAWAIPFAKRIELARNLYAEGSFKEALKEYKGILKDLPQATIVLNDIGICYIKLESTNKGIYFIKKALSYAPISKKEEIFNNLTNLGLTESEILNETTLKNKWWQFWKK